MNQSGELGLPGFNSADLSSEWTVVKASPTAAEPLAELRSKMPSGHHLHGVAVEAVAMHRHRKDIIYFVPQNESWAVVHLTYHIEHNPTWPSTIRLRTWEHVIEELADMGRP